MTLGEGLPSLPLLEIELDEMVEVLCGHMPPPIDMGIPTLAETANGYLARLREIEIAILRAERESVVPKGGKLYRFRTGELRSMIDLATKSYELGSRRMTWSQHVAESERFGREL